MTKDQVLGIIRHAITFVGAILVLKGITNESVVNEVAGSVISLVSIVWSVLSKKES